MEDIRSSPQFQAWRLFLQSYRGLVDELGVELEAAEGLPLTFYDVLAQLMMAPDNQLRMNELADRVLLSKSGLTRLVDRMEHQGLVERVACPSDRRGSLATLTNKGHATFERAYPVHVDGIKRLFADRLTDAEARTLLRALSKVAGERRVARTQERPRRAKSA